MPVSPKTWKTRPAYSFMLEYLEKKKGSMVDTDLLESLIEEYPDLGFKDFDEMLMRLEIAGKINLTNMSRGKRRVELRT